MTLSMRRRTYWTATGVLLATVAMGLMATGGGKAATKPAPPLTPEVSVIHVMDEDVATYREYPARTRGHIVNTLNSVNTKTGTMEVQAMFGNPDHAVLPGQFARVRVRTAERTQALLVPQKAVQDLQGQQSVLTLGPDDTVAVRGVVTGDRVGQRWIITQGLEPGEPVIIEGLQKVRPGLRVTPRLYTDPTPSTTGR